MSENTVFRLLDTTVAFHADAELGTIVDDAYADLASANDTPHHVIELRRRWGGRWSTAVDGTTRERRCTADTALHDVRRAIDQLALESVTATHTVIGASAIRMGGALVVMFGNIVSGKSTLAVAAARRGARLVADDIVAVDPRGAVRPYHRPINVRPTEWGRLGLTAPSGPFAFGWPVPMSRLGQLDDGGPPSLLVEVHRNDTITELAPMSPSTSLMHLSSQTLRAAGHHRAMFHRLASLARTVPAVELYHHDLDCALDLIEAQVGGGATG